MKFAEYMTDKTQMNSDESRFVHLNVQHFSEVYSVNSLTESPQSTQRAQSAAIPVTKYEKAASSRLRTRIVRIFTDIFEWCASLFHPSNNKPQRAQRTKSIIANLCALRVLCGALTLFTTKDANGGVD